MVMQMKFAQLGIDGEGGDSDYFNKAQHDAKPVETFESIEEQIGFLAKMGAGDEEAFVRYSLDDMDKLQEQFALMVKYWRGGELVKLNDFLYESLKNFDESLYDNLIGKRNANWLPIIESYIKSPEREMIIVGAAHLVGLRGIIETLKSRGYKVTQW